MVRILSEHLVKMHSSAIKGSLMVSPDSRRVVYVIPAGKKWVVVVDGVEGKQYDEIQNFVFDSTESLHYFAMEGDSPYM
jgi:hypothetical protein